MRPFRNHISRKRLLRAYAFITNYKFRDDLKQALAQDYVTTPDALLPEEYKKSRQYTEYKDDLGDAIRSKAAASLTSVSALLAFSMTVLPLAAWTEFKNLFPKKNDSEGLESLSTILLWMLPALMLPYASFWLERDLNVPRAEGKQRSEDDRRRRWLALVAFVLLSAGLFLGMPFSGTLKEILKHSFWLAGAVMIVCSILFFLFALEFYDAASGWRGNVGVHFHLAGLANNSFLFGLSLALVGSALLVCGASFTYSFHAARILATSALVALVVMMQIERALWDLGGEK